MTVSLDLARGLLDMGARLRGSRTGMEEPPQAVEQLKGAVALHNTLQREGVAYLADEVGMGKTYVALGAIALFRHFEPSFRVAVISPRENIQRKWMKEWLNFASHIVRVPDLRMKAFHGGPARALVKCENLRQFVRETTVNPEREFFLRLSSFSLGTGDAEPDLRALRDRFRRDLPWIGEAIPSLRSKRDFKDGLAKAVCCAIPEFDLVVVDEGHNLKHGFAERIAARNRVMAFVFGRPSTEVDRKLFPDYGPRARRVLFLSATPIEDDYRQLWNQLDVLGKGAAFDALADAETLEQRKRDLAKRFVIRRVTSLPVGDRRLTKNLYRREWRRGGLAEHDLPQAVRDVRQQLTVALVQKKVAELLNSPKFNSSFQMGMLASFESFLETAGAKKTDDDNSTFDDAEQTENEQERQGVDVVEVNRLAADYRRRFGAELPHPKMDALVQRLSSSWRTGRKGLVFLRRVASVWEIKERLDLAYNTWLMDRLANVFQPSPSIAADFQTIRSRYAEERAVNRRALLAARTSGGKRDQEEQDRGGLDTFFAWFFRGDGPDGPWLSGARLSRRFVEARFELSTFFEDNHAAALLGVQVEQVPYALAAAIGSTPSAFPERLATHSTWYLSAAKRHGRREIFDAAQGGALELLKTSAVDDGLRARANTEWQLLWQQRRQPVQARSIEFERALTYRTFFSELRRPEWRALRDAIWPDSYDLDYSGAVRERELRRELLSTAARLGHTLVDLYATAILTRGALRVRVRAQSPGDVEAEVDASEGSPGEDSTLIDQFLSVIEGQRRTPVPGRDWAAFDELSELASHFELILDVNEPNVRTASLRSSGRTFGELLRQQQPIGGMTGGVNQTLVRQFRMPGYPFILLSTDLLQEGEDLHTFCADVYHYGLAWTPSAIEQRIGRVDRVRSKTERVAAASADGLVAEDMLQVFYPHLADTVERLQVRRVLRRAREFIRLMHEGLGGHMPEASRLNVTHELAAPDLPEPIATPLETSFPVQAKDLEGRRRVLAIDGAAAARMAHRLRACGRGDFGMPIQWEPQLDDHSIAGTAVLPTGRSQPFVLHLQSRGHDLTVRCVSPVGTVSSPATFDAVERESRRIEQQIGLVDTVEDDVGDVTVEEEVLLGDPAHDLTRVAWLVERVTTAADRLEAAVFPAEDRTMAHVREALHAEGRVGDHAG
jgi:hypothetical protein